MSPDTPPKRHTRKRVLRQGRTLSLQAAADELRQARASHAPRLLAPASVPVLSTLPITELRRLNTSRLLPARYSDSVLTRIADSDDDLALIYALDNATNERLLAEANNRPGITARELVFEVPLARIINAAFAHPHPQGARFSTPNRGAWYAGFELATAKAEVLFHRSVQFAEIGWLAREELDYDHYYADFTGPFHDLRPRELEHDSTQTPAAARPGSTAGSASPAESPARANSRIESGAILRRACLDPGSYIASQQLALDLLEAGSLGVVYPSVRRSGGTCLACFRPGAVANVRKRELHRLIWYPDRPPTFLRVPRDKAASAETGPRQFQELPPA